MSEIENDFSEPSAEEADFSGFGDDSVEAGAEAFLDSWKEPSGEGGSSEVSPVEGQEQEPVEEQEGVTPEAAVPQEDTTEIDLGEGRKVTLGHLKALATQEAALQQRAAGIQTHQEKALAAARVHLDGLKEIQTAAQERWDQIAGLDIVAIRANSTPEEFAQFQAEVNKAWETLDTANKRVSGLSDTVSAVDATRDTQAATACAKALIDPAVGIPGYSRERHEENVSFAKSLGVNSQYLDTLYDPSAWKIIDMASQFAKGQRAVNSLKTQKVPATSKAPAHRTRSTDTTTGTKKPAIQRLRSTGKVGDAADAFLESFKN